MDDLLSVFGYTIEEIRMLFEKITLIHNDQNLQGFISDIGMSSGEYLNFQVPDNLVVVGDLHGDFTALKKIMLVANIFLSVLSSFTIQSSPQRTVLIQLFKILFPGLMVDIFSGP